MSDSSSEKPVDVAGRIEAGENHLTDELVRAVMDEIKEIVDGYLDEYGGSSADLPKFREETARDIKIRIERVLSKHGILK